MSRYLSIYGSCLYLENFVRSGLRESGPCFSASVILYLIRRSFGGGEVRRVGGLVVSSSPLS